MRATLTLLFGLPSLAMASAMVPRGPQLDPGHMPVSVADSGSYYVYSYALANASSSSWGLAAVLLDLGTSGGTPESVASTGGTLFDMTTTGADQVPHAAVGVVSPVGWRAILDRTATLMWSAGIRVRTTADSISPGDTLAGFGLRSSYLPGLTAVQYLPTMESCCSEPSDTIEGEIYWSAPDAFAVEGFAIAPRHAPGEIDVDLVRRQLAAICSNPLWLDSGPLCSEFDELLGDLEALEDGGSHDRAAILAAHLLSRIRSERSAFEPGGFWLLSLNTAQLRENLLTAAPPDR